jgi:hypothetical protein
MSIGLKKPVFYAHISIGCFSGRSVDAKRALYKSIVKNSDPFGILSGPLSSSISMKHHTRVLEAGTQLVTLILVSR